MIKNIYHIPTSYDLLLLLLPQNYHCSFFFFYGRHPALTLALACKHKYSIIQDKLNNLEHFTE